MCTNLVKVTILLTVLALSLAAFDDAFWERFDQFFDSFDDKLIGTASPINLQHISGPNDVTISMQLPGVEKKDIKIRSTNQKLEVKAAHSTPGNPQSDVNYHIEETIQPGYITDGKWRFKNNVLTIRFDRDPSAPYNPNVNYGSSTAFQSRSVDPSGNSYSESSHSSSTSYLSRHSGPGPQGSFANQGSGYASGNPSTRNQQQMQGAGDGSYQRDPYYGSTGYAGSAGYGNNVGTNGAPGYDSAADNGFPQRGFSGTPVRGGPGDPATFSTSLNSRTSAGGSSNPDPRTHNTWSTRSRTSSQSSYRNNGGTIGRQNYEVPNQGNTYDGQASN